MVVQSTAARLAFYRDTLGLEIADHSDDYGPEHERLNNVFGAHLRIRALRVHSEPGVELLEHFTPRTGRPRPSDTLADDHWQWTLNLRTEPSTRLEVVATLSDYACISNHPIELNNASLGYRRALMLRDPDGHATNLTLQ